MRMCVCLQVCLYVCECVCVCARERECAKAARLSHLQTQRKEPPPKQKGLWRFKGVVFAVFIHIAHGAAQDRR